MKYLRRRPIWLILVIYAAGGAAIGLAVPALRFVAGNSFNHGGLGVALAVNVLMPLWVITLAAAYPRSTTAVPGAILATIAFVLALGKQIPSISPPFWIGLAQAMPPVLVVACVMYQVLSLMTLLVVRNWRRVGPPPDPNACKKCGYLLIGLTQPRCPECFAPVPDPAPGLHSAT